MIVNQQTKYINYCFFVSSDEPAVISAPTGSGKTLIFELAIVRFLINLETRSCDGHFKILYGN